MKVTPMLPELYLHHTGRYLTSQPVRSIFCFQTSIWRDAIVRPNQGTVVTTPAVSVLHKTILTSQLVILVFCFQTCVWRDAIIRLTQRTVVTAPALICWAILY